MNGATSLRVAATAAALLAINAAEAADQVVWNYSVWGNPRAVTRNIEHIAQQVDKVTDGAFTIRIHYGETIAPAKEALDGLKIGAFEAAHFCASYHPGKNPAMNALDLPFLPMSTLEAMQSVHDAYYNHPVVREELARWNAIPFMSNILPQYEFMGVGTAPRTLESWKGKRVRALGGLGEAMRALGAVPTTVPAPEVYTALERGMVEAASFPFSYAHAAYKLDEIGKWYTANMAPGTLGGCGTAINRSAYEALPEAFRQALLDAKPGAYDALKTAYRDADKKYIPEFQKRGLTAIEYSDEELARFHEIAGRPVWNAWVKETTAKGLPAEELLGFILAEAKKAEER